MCVIWSRALERLLSARQLSHVLASSFQVHLRLHDEWTDEERSEPPDPVQQRCEQSLQGVTLSCSAHVRQGDGKLALDASEQFVNVCNARVVLFSGYLWHERTQNGVVEELLNVLSSVVVVVAGVCGEGREVKRREGRDCEHGHARNNESQQTRTYLGTIISKSSCSKFQRASQLLVSTPR